MKLALRIEVATATSTLFIPFTIAVVPPIVSVGILTGPLTLLISSVIIIVIIIIPLPFLLEGVRLLLELPIPKRLELIKKVSPSGLIQTLVGSIKWVHAPVLLNVQLGVVREAFPNCLEFLSIGCIWSIMRETITYSPKRKQPTFEGLGVVESPTMCSMGPPLRFMIFVPKTHQESHACSTGWILNRLDVWNCRSFRHLHGLDHNHTSSVNRLS